MVPLDQHLLLLLLLLMFVFCCFVVFCPLLFVLMDVGKYMPFSDYATLGRQQRLKLRVLAFS